MEEKAKFTIERIDEKTAKKVDHTQSVTILNMDLIRQQKDELGKELEVKQKVYDEISVIVDEFEKLPAPPKEDTVAEAEVGEE
jgi:hypothetical protein